MARRTSPAANRARQRARRRGADFERRLAQLLDGRVYPGQAGDVEAGGVIYECKYRDGLASLGELPSFIEQARRNSDARGMPWALALTGGRRFHNAAVYILLPLAEYQRLRTLAQAAEDEATLLRRWEAEAGDVRQALLALFDRAVVACAKRKHGVTP